MSFLRARLLPVSYECRDTSEGKNLLSISAKRNPFEKSRRTCLIGIESPSDSSHLSVPRGHPELTTIAPLPVPAPLDSARLPSSPSPRRPRPRARPPARIETRAWRRAARGARGALLLAPLP